jgi:GT2 family glycosyltransferase
MFEDDDFSRRVRQAGGRVVCAEDVFVHHWGRASFGALEDAAYRRLFEENRRKFEEKWGEPWRPHVARRETSARARIDSAIG